MTRKQLEKQKRNKEIRKLCKERSIEEIALVFHLSIPQIYRIIKA